MNLNNMSAMDLLNVLSVMLQLQNLEAERQSVHNEDILSELQRQDKVYLERINEKLDLLLAKIG